MKTRSAIFAVVALAGALAITSAHARAPNVEVIASGLDNPRGLAFAPNGNLYVTEAGIGGTGKCRPSPDGQPVEVCYGETGAPFFQGSSTIYRVPRSGGEAEPYLTGLTAVIDIAFDREGTLYIVEIASGLVPGPGADPGVGNGRLLRKPKNGAVEVVLEGLEGLVFPAGVATGPDGAIYLSNFGIFPGGGELLRITLD